MAELLNRYELERILARELTNMSDDQRARLRSYVGFQPDLSRVPESFWHEIQAEAEARTAVLLYLLFLASADYHADGDYDADDYADAVQVKAYNYSRNASLELAERWAESARARYEELARRHELERTLTPGDEFELREEDIDEALRVVLGETAAERIAATEMTKAQSAGGEAGAALTFGLSDEDTWKNNPHLTRTGPCPICESLHGAKRPVWELDYPDGPPIHDYCACEIVYAHAGAGI